MKQELWALASRRWQEDAELQLKSGHARRI